MDRQVRHYTPCSIPLLLSNVVRFPCLSNLAPVILFHPRFQEHLNSLFTEVVDDGLKFQREQLVEPIPTVPVQLLASLANLFTALFKQTKWIWTRPVNGRHGAGTLEAWSYDHTHPKRWSLSLTRALTLSADLKRNLESLFAFAFMWSIGGSITDEGDGYAKMDTFIRGQRAFAQVSDCNTWVC